MQRPSHKRAVIGLSVLLACGCSESSPHSLAWIGRDVSELKQAWGQPTEETVKPDGATIIYVSFWRDGPFVTHRCERAFAANAKGVITSQAASDC